MALADNLQSYWKLDGDSGDAIGSNIAFDASSSAFEDPTWNHTCSGSNRILFVSIIGDTSDNITKCTYNGDAMTLLTKGSNSARWVYFYYLINPDTGTNEIEITGYAYPTAVAASYTGVKQTGFPDSNSGRLTGTDVTSKTVTNTVVASNCWLVMLSGTHDGNPSTAGSGTTLRVQRTGEGTDTCAILDSNGVVGNGSQSLIENYNAAADPAVQMISMTSAGNNGTDTDIAYGVENLTGYTETDPNSHITKTSSKISFAGLTRNEDAYVYKDFTANYFNGSFTHYVTVYFQDTGGDNNVAVNWQLTNDIDDYYGLISGGKSFLAVVTQKYGTALYMYLREQDGANYYQDSNTALSLDTPYYLTITRDEDTGTYGTMYCYIYSDSTRETLVDTLTVALHTSKKDFRYLFGLNTYNDADANAGTGYTENLILASETYGKINQGAGFNGDSSKIVGSAVNIGTNATISAWFKTSQNANYPAIFGFNKGANDVQFAIGKVGNNVVGYLEDSAGTAKQIDGGNYSDGNWHFATLVKTGSSIELFIDNSSKGSGSETFGGNFNSAPMYIGYTPSTVTTQYFNGAVDECAYWSRALSSAEVGQLYNSGNGNQYPFSTAYSLAVTVGAFTLTGIATTLLKALKMAIAVGSFVLTGIDVTFKRGKSMIANVGSFIISWKDVIFKGLWGSPTKHTSSYSNATKNTAIYSNKSKNTSSWSYKDKH